MDDFIKPVSEYLVNFFDKKGYIVSISLIQIILTIICSSGIVVWLLKLIRLIHKANRERILLKDLHPFFTLNEIERATKLYIDTKCQNIPPSREQEPRLTHAFVTKEKLIPFFINNVFKNESEEQRFYIILADSGMGKTTFMINLYQKYVSTIWKRKYDIKLLPLGYPYIDNELESITDEKKANTILLLDAFDEDLKAVLDYRKRMDEIIDKVWKFRKVIVTCRTQFFPFEEEEPGELKIKKYGNDGGFHSFLKIYVSPFDDKDISLYLIKKYSLLNWNKRSQAKEIVSASPDLMVRPMLLNYIDDLLEPRGRYEYGFQIYERLIDKWINREVNRKDEVSKYKFREELNKFSEEIALEIYYKFRQNSQLYINGSEIEPFANNHNIELETIEMKSRSLLNRDAEAHYKFSHKSILEYFLAIRAFKNAEFNLEADFNGMSQAIKFYRELCLYYHTIPFFNKKSQDFEGGVKNTLLDAAAFSKDKYYIFGEIKNKTDINGLKYVRVKSMTTDTFKVLAGIPNLEVLEMTNLNLTGKELDCLDFRILDCITDISLSNNKLSSIKSLKYLKKLKTLLASDNRISDLSPLIHLENLQRLDLDDNNINFLGALGEMKNLKYLDIAGNQILNLDPLKKLENLKSVNLRNNDIELAAILELRKALERCTIDSEGGFDLLIKESQGYPNKDFKPINSFRNTNGEFVELFEFVGEDFSAFGLFNDVQVHLINGGANRNIIYKNLKWTILDILSLKKLIEIIYSNYGVDDNELGEFHSTEIKAINENSWSGRVWYKRSNFPYPILLMYNSEKGIELTIIGLAY